MIREILIGRSRRRRRGMGALLRQREDIAELQKTPRAGTVEVHKHYGGGGGGGGHDEAHTIASHSDTTATGAELETLTDGSETALHSHAGGGGSITQAWAHALRV